MPNWLTKAKKVFRRGRPSVPFAVTSSAGRVVEGVRSTEHQVVHCPATGERLFVLPIDAFPSPAVPSANTTNKSKSKKSRRGKKEKTDGPAAEPSREAVEASPAKPRRRRRLLPSKEGVKRGIRLVKDRASAWFTPMRALVLGVLVVVVLTSWWTLRSRARANAEIVLRNATRDGWAALEAGELEEADDAFQRVVRALDTLGTDDPLLRRVAAETNVVVQLSTVPLVDVLLEADRFDARHRGQWMVFDGSVVAGNDHTGRPVVYVEFPFEIDGHPVDVVADPAMFEGLEVPGEEDGRTLPVIFAAKLDRLERTDGPFPRWTLEFELGTGFVWTHPDTLAATGLGGDAFRSDVELADQLARQARVMGVEP